MPPCTTRRRRLHRAAARPFAALLAAAVAAPLAAAPPEWVSGWRDDIALLAAELARLHPAPAAELEAAGVAGRLAALAERVPELEHHEIAVELAAALALLGDGHTRLTLPLPPRAGLFQGHSPTPPPTISELRFHALPVRLRLFDDGLFLVAVPSEHPEWAGARVLGLGRGSADEAIAAVAPVVHRDTPQQLRDRLPSFLISPEVLHARGVADSPGRVALRLRLRDGSLREIELEPEAWEARAPPLPAARLLGSPEALRDARPETAWWLDRLAAGEVLYLRYRECLDQEDETVRGFAERVAHQLAADPPQRVVLDLRGNHGGDASRNLPLLHALIAAGLDDPGELVVLLDEGVFSATVMLVADLERHTTALFAGAPTASGPTHYGDARKITLPATGLTARISTLRWQLGHPEDGRDAFVPQLSAPLTAEAFLSGRDPALEAVLPHPASDSPAGAWTGEIAAGPERLPFSIALVAGPDAAWQATLARPDGSSTTVPARVDGARVRWELPRDPWPNVFTGQVDGERMFGVFEQGSTRAPFLLRRSDPGD
ncbi:MAG TPA: hypothetical protein VMT16_02050 [Thermoanaerobaculia bacterium]|nr:hypothetical protein [Thermoanaerobaculia bacterium]